jgi:5,10-methylenetetrahydromethanopterin reductase
VLAAIALGTERLRIGPAVTDPYTRHPAITAAAIATLDELSGGRARLGIGAGIAGFENLDIQLRHPATAVAEAIDTIRPLLAGQTTTVEGKVVTLRGGHLLFPARADLPIYVAAAGPRMLKTAGSVADGIIVAHLAQADALRQRLMPALEATRRRPDALRVIARLDVTINGLSLVALDAARVRVGRVLWASYPDLSWVAAAGCEIPTELDHRLRMAGPFARTHDLGAFKHLADAIPDDIVRLVAISGDEGAVAAGFRDLFAAGVDEVMVHPLPSAGVGVIEAIEQIGCAFAQARESSAA